jgi:hypothetical protein
MVAAAHAASSAYDRNQLSVPAPAAWGDCHVSFSEALEMINPLQYVPVVGMIYREITGHAAHPALRIAVSTAVSLLFGGPIGLGLSMASAAATEVFDHRATTPDATRMAGAAQAYSRVARLA